MLDMSSVKFVWLLLFYCTRGSYAASCTVLFKSIRFRIALCARQVYAVVFCLVFSYRRYFVPGYMQEDSVI